MRLRRRKLWPRKRRRIRKLRLSVLLLVLLGLSLVSFTYGLITAVATEIPDLDPARIQAREQNGYVYDRRGQKILAVLRGSESRVLLESSEIAPLMKHAIVAIEDRRFFDHRGVDLRAIARAFWADVRHKEIVQGGSTITQQFIKNALIEDDRSIGRKLKEAALAWQLEQDWSKDKILTEYLNTIYFGNGAYGIQQAALTYFKHGASKLTLPEAALLAAIPSDPARYDPVANPRAARARRGLVLQAMFEQGIITRTGLRKALRAPLPPPDGVRLPGTRSQDAPYFVNYVMQQLVDKYGTAEVFGGGLKVRTTIDLELQAIGREAIAKWLTNDEGPEAALVAVNPQNGDVLAMIGGSNFRESQFNLAVQGERQPGSSFKPFVLAAALDQGISPQNTFASREIDIPFDNKIWHVENYEGSYVGRANLQTATILSDNTVYAQLTSLVGPRNVARMAERLGIKSALQPYLSIGLGAQGVNPLEMARAFSAFANGGLRVDGEVFGNRPRAIAWVRRKGETEMNEPAKRRVLTPAKAATVNSILQQVITQGTGKRAALKGFVAAGKTGTTENHGDAWFVGYTPRLAVAVWVGYPKELRPMLTEFDGQEVAGGTWPALIWKTFMQKALTTLEVEPEPFPSPGFLYSGSRYVVWRNDQLQLDNGYCRNAVQLLVFSGEGPTRTANCKPNEVSVPTLLRTEVGEARAQLAAQPLTPTIVYKWARPGQRLGLVVGQFPAGGRTLSANDEVTLVVTKPRHGVVPTVVGLRLERALRRLERVKLRPVVPKRDGDDPSPRIVRQFPAGGVAAAPGMTVRLVVARG